jgi:D-alanyl-D-alanine carboxypeptidase/D-alanyl-D-alanine-endopeptidase (penicillin-binding protein 4)
MLLYSNNFMANQIYLKSGVKRYGYPATWHKAKKAMEIFLESNHLITHPITIIDGAGLAQENSVNCRTMIAVLQKFRKYADMLPLKKNIPLKSGTMTGVYSYAGYLSKRSDAPAFVLILNQKENNRDALLNQLKQQ